MTGGVSPLSAPVAPALGRGNGRARRPCGSLFGRTKSGPTIFHLPIKGRRRALGPDFRQGLGDLSESPGETTRRRHV